ncbi:MAG: hypothetical protein ACRDJE_00535 [Dehalococcoidia bacterium]
MRPGALLLALFALVWAATGISGIGNDAAVLAARLLALLVTAVVALLVLRADSTGTDRPRGVPEDWRRRFNLVSIIQFTVIGVAVAVLVMTGRPMLIPATVCLIVGAHFVPLARIFDQQLFAWTGAALCMVATVGYLTVVAVDGAAARAVVGVGAAVLLWGTAAWMALRG